MKRLLMAAMMVAFMMGNANASGLSLGGTTNNGGDGGNATAKASASAGAVAVAGSSSAAELNAAFKNFLAQGQQQGQSVDNSDSVSVRNDFKAQKQPASVAVSAPSFGADVSDGVINACSGTEAWSVTLGGAFFTPTGNPVTAGVGGGNQTLTTLNLCEIRAVAWELSGRTEGPAAEKIYHAVMCQHPTYRAATIASGGICPTIPAYSMTVSLGSPATVKAESPSQVVASASPSKGTGSQNPDFAHLQ